MPYKLEWHVPSKVVHAEFLGVFTIEEMTECNIKIRDEYLDKGDKPVHIIFELENVISYPTQVLQVKKVSDIYMQHPSLGWVQLVGIKNPLLGFLANTVAQTLRLHTQQAKSMTEAMERLTHIDPTLENAIK
jgi:hypothetical protein